MLATACPSEAKDAAPVLTRILLVVEYDGTGYAGFQWQKGQPTIQAELENALFRLTGERLRVVCSSRTDAGVHAENQVVSFRTSSTLPLANFVSGLNYYLPGAIAVKSAHVAPGGFHVQRSAISREYRYYVLNRNTRSPLWERFAHRIGGPLDMAALEEACRALVGEHDFASFTTAECARLRSTVRTMQRAEAAREGELLVFGFVANSFLTHQVRSTVGALLEVGQHRMSVKDFCSIMERKEPGLAGPRAPAHGLRLVRVNYPFPIEENKDENI